jgi:hypothetical protein
VSLDISATIIEVDKNKKIKSKPQGITRNPAYLDAKNDEPI